MNCKIEVLFFTIMLFCFSSFTYGQTCFETLSRKVLNIDRSITTPEEELVNSISFFRNSYSNASSTRSSFDIFLFSSSLAKQFEKLFLFGDKKNYKNFISLIMKEHKSLNYEIDALLVFNELRSNDEIDLDMNDSEIQKLYHKKFLSVLKRMSLKSKKSFSFWKNDYLLRMGYLITRFNDNEVSSLDSNISLRAKEKHAFIKTLKGSLSNLSTLIDNDEVELKNDLRELIKRNFNDYSKLIDYFLIEKDQLIREKFLDLFHSTQVS